jgi:hypothetical protein
MIGLRRLSFLARSMGLEVFSAPFNPVPTTRCAAAVAKSTRCLSTASQLGPVQTKVIRPANTKIILPRMPEGLYFPYSTNMWGGKEPIQQGPKLPVLT